MQRLAILFLLSVFGLVACESAGYTPDCPPMPITKDGPNSPEIVAWRKEAVPKGCATAAYVEDSAGGAAGAAGAGN